MDWGERSSTGDEKSSPTEGSAEFKSFSQVRIHTGFLLQALIAVAVNHKLSLCTGKKLDVKLSRKELPPQKEIRWKRTISRTTCYKQTESP
jgi:hypothetical protein